MSSSPPLALRVRKGIQRALIDQELPGFNYPESGDGLLDDDGLPIVQAGVKPVAGLIVRRKHPDVSKLTSPVIVISPARSTYARSAAGMAQRNINTLVSFFWRSDNTDTNEKAETHNPETQELIVETVKAMFHLNPQMPISLVAHAPEVEECRVLESDQFIPAAYRNQVDVHRVVISCQTCSVAGVP